MAEDAIRLLEESLSSGVGGRYGADVPFVID